MIPANFRNRGAMGEFWEHLEEGLIMIFDDDSLRHISISSASALDIFRFHNTIHALLLDLT